MAGDWIKMRADLQTHPKVVRISSALKADRLRTVGGLHAVWCLFDAHSEDGRLCGYTPDALDDLIGWSGFSLAMKSVGWLEIDGDSLALPEFDAHNGQSAKRRAQESDRKRKDRLDQKTSASNADKLRTREEKRREDISTPIGVDARKPRAAKFDPSKIDLPPWLPRQPWVDWCADRAQRRKPITERAAQQQIKQLDKYRAEGHTPDVVIANSIAGSYQGLFPPKAQGKAASEPPWWGSESTTIAKGREYGLSPRPGEDMPQFRGRINEAIGARKAA